MTNHFHSPPHSKIVLSHLTHFCAYTRVSYLSLTCCKRKQRVYTLHWHRCSHSISLCVSLFFVWRKENLQCGIGSQQPPSLYVGFLWSNSRSFVSWTVFLFKPIQWATGVRGDCRWLWIRTRWKGLREREIRASCKLRKNIYPKETSICKSIFTMASFLSG